MYANDGGVDGSSPRPRMMGLEHFSSLTVIITGWEDDGVVNETLCKGSCIFCGCDRFAISMSSGKRFLLLVVVTMERFFLVVEVVVVC